MKSVIFDMDGLLLDSENETFKAFKKIGGDMGYTVTRDFYCSMIGVSEPDAIKMLTQKFGDGFDGKGFFVKVREYVKNSYSLHGVPVKEGAKELLSFLKESGVLCAVGSSSAREWVEKLLKSAGLFDYFDAFVCGDEVKNAKPDPEIFIKACKKLGVQAEDAVVLEDSPFGVEAAHKAGVPVICVPDMLYPDENIIAMTTAVCGSLKEVKNYFQKIRL
ncbi:MAG: HAD family hydrolase [Acutalibacteraceae bacterium]